MLTLLIGLFFVNAFAHIISYLIIKKNNSSGAASVLSYAVINASIAALILLNVEWVKWPALILPAIGALGLLATCVKNKGGNWIDYVILILDAVTVGVVLKFFIF